MLEHVDVPRLEALNAYWTDHPPLQWMIASYFGIKPKPAPNSTTELKDLMTMFPSG